MGALNELSCCMCELAQGTWTIQLTFYLNMSIRHNRSGTRNLFCELPVLLTTVSILINWAHYCALIINPLNSLFLDQTAHCAATPYSKRKQRMRRSQDCKHSQKQARLKQVLLSKILCQIVSRKCGQKFSVTQGKNRKCKLLGTALQYKK